MKPFPSLLAPLLLLSLAAFSDQLGAALHAADELDKKPAPARPALPDNVEKRDVTIFIQMRALSASAITK